MPNIEELQKVMLEAAQHSDLLNFVVADTEMEH